MTSGLRIEQVEGELGSALATHAMRSALDGRRPVALFTAAYAPTCRTLLDALARPDAGELRAALADVDLLVVDVDAHDVDLVGFEVNGVPHVEGLDVRGRAVRHALRGRAWGGGTLPELTRALVPFLATLPPLAPVVPIADDVERRPRHRIERDSGKTRALRPSTPSPDEVAEVPITWERWLRPAALALGAAVLLGLGATM